MFIKSNRKKNHGGDDKWRMSHCEIKIEQENTIQGTITKGPVTSVKICLVRKFVLDWLGSKLKIC